MTREILEAHLLLLPAEERAHLARVLIDSLDEHPDLDPAWPAEAERRAAALVAGLVVPHSAEDAFAEARRKLAGWADRAASP